MTARGPYSRRDNIRNFLTTDPMTPARAAAWLCSGDATRDPRGVSD